MKKTLVLLSLLFLFISSNSFSASEDGVNAKKESKEKVSLKSSYGIYGEVLYPVSGNPYNVVEGPTVLIYKLVSGNWVLQASTTASICGYYTYDTGGTGRFRAVISGYYYLRNYPGCTARNDYNMHAGSGEGDVTLWTPNQVVNVRCS